MQNSILTLAGHLFDLLLPPRQSELLVRELSVEKLQELANYDGTLPYHDAAVRALIWELKYRARGRAAMLAGGYLREELLAIAEEELGPPLLIPMPMHPARRKERGFNQTEVLCEAALKALEPERNKSMEKSGLPGRALGVEARTGDPRTFSEVYSAPVFAYAPDILERIKATPPQQGLERHVRLVNVKQAMAVRDASRVKGRVCVVVDDVSTTGATLAEARRALRTAGARAVHLLPLAHS